MAAAPGRIAAATAAVALVLTLAACGEEGGSGEEFASAADRICTVGAEAARAAFLDSVEESGQLDTPAYLGELSSIRANEASDLEAIETDPPDEARAGYEELLRLRRQAIDLLEEAMGAAEMGGGKGFEAARAEVESKRREADAVASEIGLTACANELSAESKRAITQVLEGVATGEPEQICGELLSERLVEAVGGQEACVEGQKEGPEVSSVGVERLIGVDEVSAMGVVEATTPGGKTSRTDVDVFYGDGAWRVETFNAVE